MTRVLLCAIPVYGHVMPLRRIARDLVERGYDVLFLTGSLFRTAIEQTGARFCPLPAEADIVTGFDELFPERETIRSPAERLEFDAQHVFARPMVAQHQAIQALLAEDGAEPTIILHDTVFLGVWPIRHGAPGIEPLGVVGIGVVPLPLADIDHAPFGYGLLPDSSVEGRDRNRRLAAEARELTDAGSYRELVAGFQRAGATEPPPQMSRGLVCVPDRFLQLSIESLDYPRSEPLPPQLRYVGALPPEQDIEATLPEWWDEVVAADRVAVVSQGTLANANLGMLIEPTLRALADLDVLVVVCTGRDVTPTDVPANARVAEFIPFDLLLPHVDVLVSNGGFGGVQQALSHGVPLVLAGSTEDKVEVGARAEWSGAAVNLATGEPDESDIRKAVEETLQDPSRTERAGQLRSEYAARDPYQAIVNAIEELAGGQG
ncbi:glycosyltransferase [Actinoalloteichus hymeniacidonis]|uniref:Glycosyl transferase, UDP-glucuronosyltransferase n=1 Tax=Actinoalloteichus hymeniacidonis TaxID=340345 RepID=A0AAC9HQ52_9PSEU|nr:nucleotide disphospho-sugar-binding domain-containing protein [Actinoalloteichus hymeniacidonis]AOS63266.1 glycosyl transferase, UDP-glucuronosyltransferase [Actinoalloteichus hymeniacidonis]MBB5908695.1 UDP:flavonoid glycosyltransferase YjiC (YdhE family) [Actinoalloteichus hymeniacidonis]